MLRKKLLTGVSWGLLSLSSVFAQGNPDCGAMGSAPKVSYELPGEVLLTDQQTLNCYAWSNFLALNWKAGAERGQPDTSVDASQYGQPGDFSPTVWESYLSLEEVFTDNGAKPWSVAKNPLKKAKTFKKVSKIKHTLPNNNVLKTADEDTKISELFQAKGTFLTDQKGKLVWYEIKVNEDEYNFITKHKLYDPAEQDNYAKANGGLWIPGGQTEEYGPTGALELKAAWKVVDSSDLSDVQKKYKVSLAMVPEVTGFDNKGQPILGENSQQHIALVGLHIIRKTQLAHQLIWMTFEHIDNAPTQGQVPTGDTYSFYSASSQDTPNQAPDPSLANLNKPVQVERISQNALSEDIQTLNDAIQKEIRDANPDSVFQYYQLINVQWPQNAIADRSNNGGKTPLQAGGITPSNIANVTMETYAQSTQCMDCHKYATTPSGKWATDYSFIYSKAVQQKENKK